MTRLQPVRIPRTRALWLQEALAREPAAERVEPLSGAHKTDICIVGGGYTGLWTALRIKDLDPSVDVMLLEADLCGSGASGRNGGLALGWLYKLDTLASICGEDEAVRLVRASVQAISEIGDFCDRHGVEAYFRQAGLLHTATTPLHMGVWDKQVQACERRGIEAFEQVTPDEVASRTGSAVHVGGVLDRTAATVQPALLARGMRRVASERGVRIFERTPVTDLDEGNPPVVRTPQAAVVASKVVLATNAWAAGLHELRRVIIVVSSDMVATAPIPERLKEIGWTGGEGISDARVMVYYYQATHDGLIAIGRGSGALAYLGQVPASFNHDPRRAAVVRRGLRRLYPALADVPVTHEWAGPIDRTWTNTLACGRLGGNRSILYGIGYSGTGVAPSVLGGRILASSALERVDEWSTTRLNQGPLSLFPPEPVRFFGGLLVRSAVFHKEEGEERGVPANRLLRAVAALAPPRPVPNER